MCGPEQRIKSTASMVKRFEMKATFISGGSGADETAEGGQQLMVSRWRGTNSRRVLGPPLAVIGASASVPSASADCPLSPFGVRPPESVALLDPIRRSVSSHRTRLRLMLTHQLQFRVDLSCSRTANPTRYPPPPSPPGGT